MSAVGEGVLLVLKAHRFCSKAMALGWLVPGRDGLCSVVPPVRAFAKLSSHAVFSKSVSASGSLGAEKL